VEVKWMLRITVKDSKFMRDYRQLFNPIDIRLHVKDLHGTDPCVEGAQYHLINRLLFIMEPKGSSQSERVPRPKEISRYFSPINILKSCLSKIHFNIILEKIPYLRVYKPHFLTRLCPPKLGCGLYTEFKNLVPPRKSRYHIDDWAHDAGIVCCETPSRDR
jgi:hypothetical protein